MTEKKEEIRRLAGMSLAHWQQLVRARKGESAMVVRSLRLMPELWEGLARLTYQEREPTAGQTLRLFGSINTLINVAVARALADPAFHAFVFEGAIGTVDLQEFAKQLGMTNAPVQADCFDPPLALHANSDADEADVGSHRS